MHDHPAGYTAAQIRSAEAPHLAAGEPLMLRAAAGLAAHVRELIRERNIGAGGRATIVLLVGSGDNGGDALFAGAELAAESDVTALTVGPRFHRDGMRAARAAGVRVLQVADAPASVIVGLASSAHILVDGIVGTGMSGSTALRGAARELVGMLLPIVAAPDGPAVVAVDIPSGMNPDTGEADAVELPAALTVTFGGVKAGLLTPNGARIAGEVRLVLIGIEDDLAAL